MIKLNKGFTLIELMIVIAIMAILAAIVLPTYKDYVDRQKATKVMNGQERALLREIRSTVGKRASRDIVKLLRGVRALPAKEDAVAFCDIRFTITTLNNTNDGAIRKIHNGWYDSLPTCDVDVGDVVVIAGPVVDILTPPLATKAGDKVVTVNEPVPTFGRCVELLSEVKKTLSYGGTLSHSERTTAREQVMECIDTLEK